MDLSSTIIPKSDQLNADDLIAGPRTIRITNVLPGSKEQPISITFDGDNARPYKPSKSMRRVLVTLWGSEGDAYVGRRITLFRDATVKWAGEEVGGISISHASDIPAAVSVMLTVSRSKRKPHVVEPLGVIAPTVTLANLPEAWPEWTNEERGTNRASLGMATLQEWWGSLTPAERKTLKPKLDSEWKATAEAVK